MTDRTWISGEQTTIPALLDARLERTPTASTSTCAAPSSPRPRWRTPPRGSPRASPRSASRRAIGWPALLENSPEAMLAWWGVGARRPRRRADQHRVQGRVPAPPARTTRGRPCSWSSGRLADRVAAVIDDLPDLRHVIVVEDDDAAEASDEVSASAAGARESTVGRPARRGREAARRDDPPVGPRHVRLHRRHDRAIEGLHAQPRLPRGAHQPDRLLLAAHRRRRAVDPAADVPLQRARHRGARLAGVRRPLGDLPPVLRLQLLAGDEPHRRHHHVDARHDGVPARPRRGPSGDAEVGCAGGEHVAAAARRRAAAGRGRRHHQGPLRARRRSAGPTA